MKAFLIGVGITAAVLAALAALLFYGLPYYLAPQDVLAKADAIVAISGGETTSRAQTAIELYQEGWAPKLIFSGAAQDPNSASNAAVMRKLAVAAGVPASRIIMDETSVDTHENAVNVASIAQAGNYHKIILVTSPYHQRRASIEFQRALGKSVTVINHSATDHNWRRSAWWRNTYSLNLTLSELQKIIFLYANKS